MQFRPNILSTNALLKELIQQGDACGAPLQNFFALYTNYQTGGRGMGSNRWFSDDGKNILASFHFLPAVPPAQQFLFNQYFALCASEFLRRYVTNVEIKWPNDIYVSGKKIAGILIEHTLQGNRIAHTIAGIGININQDIFPDDIPYPTSLFLETGKEHNPVELLNGFRQLLQDRYDMLSIQQAKTLKEQYFEHLYQLNEWHNYLVCGEPLVARILDTDVFGQLIIEEPSGRRHTCAFKEIRYIRDERP